MGFTWQDLFDERQRKEIEFSRLYAGQFAHGTDGHNSKLIIAKLAGLLDQHYDDQVKPVDPHEV
jgi:hypothetical protein